MRRVNFRLALEPGLEGVVRLAQLHQYAVDLVDERRVLIGPALRAHVAALFPRKPVTTVLGQLLGHGPPGWDLEGAARGEQTLIIKTVDQGVAFSAIARIIEHIAPEALTRPMTFEPGRLIPSIPTSKRLH